MKFLIFFFCNVFFVLTTSGQRMMWQYDFEVRAVYVRTDTSCQMLKKTIQIPSSGYVIARIEGLCEVSKNDVITMGVSNYNQWSANFGNVGCVSFDSIYTQHHFQHTMVYKVDKNDHTFYALAQNWTDRNGTGFFSAKGQMFLEFIPDEKEEPMVFFRRINLYPIVLNDTVKTLQTLQVSLQKPGKVLLSADGRLYSNPNNEIEISILSSDFSTLRKADSYHVHHKKLNILSMYTTLDLPAGDHTFILAATKTKGNQTTSNNAYYGTFYATIFPEDNQDVFTKSVSFEGVANQYDDENLFSELSMDIPSKGTVYVLTTGQVDIRLNDQFDIRVKADNNNFTEEFSASCQTTHIAEEIAYFNRKQIFEVEAGKFDVALYGQMTGNTGNSLPSDIKGDVVITFVADPVISSVKEASEQTALRNVVYPNPVTNQLYIRNPDGLNVDELIVKDTRGRVLFNLNQTAEGLDVSSLPAGMYILSIRQENKVEYHKFFKSTPSF
ncbi:MAG: T9SS type A sorting domain-containing protein [Saprospiraceae bacterium]|nr:T9SS type A sorting domain-containing protein [Saprospiraceae bacterium]